MCHFLVKNISNQNFFLLLFILFIFLSFFFSFIRCITIAFILLSQKMSVFFLFLLLCFPFLSFFLSVRPFFCLISVAGFSVLWSVGQSVNLSAFLHTFHSSFPPLFPLLLFPSFSLSLSYSLPSSFLLVVLMSSVSLLFVFLNSILLLAHLSL